MEQSHVCFAIKHHLLKDEIRIKIFVLKIFHMKGVQLTPVIAWSIMTKYCIQGSKSKTYIRVEFQYKDHLFRYWYSHYKDKSIVRLSYIDDGNSYTGRIPIMKIRWWWDHLIFMTGIPVLLRRNLYIETAPRSLSPKRHTITTHEGDIYQVHFVSLLYFEENLYIITDCTVSNMVWILFQTVISDECI